MKLLALFVIFFVIQGCSGGGGGGGSVSGGSVSGGSGSGEATVTWTAPTTRENGAPLILSELAGFYVKYQLKNSKWHQIKYINDATATLFSLKNVAAGTYLVQTATVDFSGLVSDYSNTIEVNI
jgi:hypothetical protein